MKGMDLMYAMTELDDDLLEHGTERKDKRFPLSRVLAVAAAAAVLTVTVFAAAAGINYWSGKDDSIMEYRFEREPATIRQEALDEMTEALNRRWVEDEMDYFVRNGVDTRYYSNMHVYMEQDIVSSLTSVEKIENYLGIDLATSPELDTLLDACLNESTPEIPRFHAFLYGPSYQDSLAEYESTGNVSLHGVVLRMENLGENPDSLVGFEIIIPLTKEFVQEYPTYHWSATDRDGQLGVKNYSNGSLGFVIACDEYTEGQSNTCVALYTDECAGYQLSCCSEPVASEIEAKTRKDAESVIMELIENVK